MWITAESWPTYQQSGWLLKARKTSDPNQTFLFIAKEDSVGQTTT